MLAGDFSGFPNGRRLADDVTDIELRAVACGYGPIVGPIIERSGSATDSNRPNNVDRRRGRRERERVPPSFPYVAAPNQGYAHTGHK